MKCKNCGHPITIAGGLRFHTEESGFSHTCKVCGCQLPEEEDEDEMVNNK